MFNVFFFDIVILIDLVLNYCNFVLNYVVDSLEFLYLVLFFMNLVKLRG